MNRGEIFQAIDEGRLAELVEATDLTKELNEMHNALFHRALEVGVLRESLIRRIDEASFEAARLSLMDEREIKQMSRRSMEDYDPKLAIEVYRSQIHAMLDSFNEAAKEREEGINRPEENLFNLAAYGQMLSTSALDGTPEVAVFTGLARLEGRSLLFGRIGQDKSYRNLKENPKAVFTAVGPSNNPTKIDFITIDVELQDDRAEGKDLEQGRDLFGPSVANLLIFSVTDMRLVHLPKPDAQR